VHYLLDDFTLKKALFGVVEIAGSSTGENIKTTIIEYVHFIGLDHKKMTCVVRDDAANVKLAAKLMGKAR
jgi:hypothetical protein